MRQVMRKGLLSAAAAGGVLVMSAGATYADSDATGSSDDSPGVASGNVVQVPVSVPVNLCGNTINAVGILNPAMGNGCVNGGGEEEQETGGGGGSAADGVASGSPGVGSGNEIQVPIEVPVNACGNSVNVVGLGNAVADNDCANGSGSPPQAEPAVPEEPAEPAVPQEPGEPGEPEEPQVPAPQEEEPDQPEEPADGEAPPDADDEAVPEPQTGAQEPADDPAPQGGELAQTGAGLELVAVLPLGAGLLLGGALLYRRRGSRPARRG